MISYLFAYFQKGIRATYAAVVREEISRWAREKLASFTGWADKSPFWRSEGVGMDDHPLTVHGTRKGLREWE